MELQLNEWSDEALVAASREGDRTAYAALVRRHAKRLYAICLGILGSAADGEDMVQETFVRGLANIRSLRNEAQFAAWISQIARNLCRDHLRDRGRERALLSETPAPDPVTSNDTDYADLHLALAELPEQYRTPLMLFYFDGKSTEKLAEELNLTQAGACTRLHRARNELRRLLARRKDAQ